MISAQSTTGNDISLDLFNFLHIYDTNYTDHIFIFVTLNETLNFTIYHTHNLFCVEHMESTHQCTWGYSDTMMSFAYVK